MNKEQQKFFEETTSMIKLVHTDYDEYKNWIYYKNPFESKLDIYHHINRLNTNLDYPFNLELDICAYIIPSTEILIINTHDMRLDTYNNVDVVLRGNLVIIQDFIDIITKNVKVYYFNEISCQIVYNEVVDFNTRVTPLLSGNFIVSLRSGLNGEIEDKIYVYSDIYDNIILDYIRLYNNKGRQLMGLEGNIRTIGCDKNTNNLFEYKVRQDNKDYYFIIR